MVRFVTYHVHESPPHPDTTHRQHLHKVLSKPGPFTDEEWTPGSESIEALELSKILSVYSL